MNSCSTASTTVISHNCTANGNHKSVHNTTPFNRNFIISQLLRLVCNNDCKLPTETIKHSTTSIYSHQGLKFVLDVEEDNNGGNSDSVWLLYSQRRSQRFFLRIKMTTLKSQR
ncbi:unnamed protein product [Amaranthus hypochondriacus]